MNKKALMAVTLVAVFLMVVPMVASTQARRSKATFTVFGWNHETLEEETKECRGMTIIKSHGIGMVMIISPAVGEIPVVGTSEFWITKRFDPETGYGTYNTVTIWDITGSGGGKIISKSSGKVAGIHPVYGPGSYVVAEGHGVGMGSYKGFRTKTLSSVQLSLPAVIGGMPAPFGGQPGLLAIGKVIY